MTDWSSNTIGGIALEAATGPFGSAVSSRHFVMDGVPMLRGSNLSDEVGIRLDTADLVFLPESIVEQFPRAIARAGDLVFTCWGTIGQIGLLNGNEDHGRFLVSNKQMRMRPDPQEVDPTFLYYFLSQPSMVDLVRGQAIGSSVPGFNLGQLRSLAISYPSLPEQQAIAEVLGALDDKIAANTALAATADGLVRVEYDTLDGCRVRVGEVADSPRSGVNPMAIDPDELYVGLEHVGRRRMWLDDGGRAREVTSTKSQFEPGDVLFGKLRPYFHKIVSAPAKGICSTDILVVRAREESASSSLMAALASDAVVEAVVAASEGTRMPRTSWKDLAAVEITWPAGSQHDRYVARLNAIRNAAIAALAENRTLAATRDALLPQLMSGKLRVSEAERFAEQAGM